MQLEHNYQQQMLKNLFSRSNDKAQEQELLSQIASNSSLERLNVYRNNVFYSLIQALADSYPACHSLVGEQCFSAIAADYISEHPPTQASLTYYGQSFAEYLSGHEACLALGYLADVAKIEWHYLQAFHSADTPNIDASLLHTLSAEQLPDLCFTLKPEVCFIDSHWPVQAIWQANLQTEVPMLDLDELTPSKLLICRPEFEVQVIDLDVNCFNFAQGLANDLSIEQAWNHCLEVNQREQLTKVTETDLGQMLSYLLSLKLFSTSTIKQ